MYSLVRKTLEIYLKEKRVLTLSDFPMDISQYNNTKDAVFVTLYYQGRVIASSGRIACQKENTLYECIDNTLLCLKDSRFSAEIQDIQILSDIHIRTDRLESKNRRVLRDISELDTNREGLLLLSATLGRMSVILPHMVHGDTSPGTFLELACKKINLDARQMNPTDVVLYGLSTQSESDFG